MLASEVCRLEVETVVELLVERKSDLLDVVVVKLFEEGRFVLDVVV